MDAVPRAMPHSKLGDLMIYDVDSICRIVSTLPEVELLPVTEPPLANQGQSFEGFAISRWASYAKNKSAIATRMCKENGMLKSRLVEKGISVSQDDPLYEVRRLKSVRPMLRLDPHLLGLNGSLRALMTSRLSPPMCHQCPG